MNVQIDLVFKIAAIGIIVAVLNQLLIRSGREEMAMLTTLAGLLSAMMVVLAEVNKLFIFIKATFGF